MAALRAIGASRGAPALRPPPGQRREGSGGLRAHLDRWAQRLGAVAGWAQRGRLQNLNAYPQSPRDTFGDDAAAAEFTLAFGGGVRFLGQQRWIRPGSRSELPQLWHLPVVGIDLSGTPITYRGLDNLGKAPEHPKTTPKSPKPPRPLGPPHPKPPGDTWAHPGLTCPTWGPPKPSLSHPGSHPGSRCPPTVSLSHLSHLDLSGCPHVSDWALGRLHVFGATLQHLALARCPQVTERGLATLHHLRELRSLDVSGLSVPSPGLLRVLLEEALPGCQVLGMAEAGAPPGPPQK
ncbi:distal membrane-arm assembly complex protein 2 isoform 1-T1 [Cyanocitta cristata]